MNTTYATVVLAAGKGTRMRSELPKVLHQVAGQPLLAHVLNAIEDIPSAPAFASLQTTLSGHRPVVVVGYGAEHIAANFGERCSYALQEEQLGTGHAVLIAQAEVDALDPRPEIVLVCYGDTPLVTGEVLARVLAEHCARQATVTFLTGMAQLPSDYGRVVRDARGNVREIVEVKRASEEQKSIREVNSGVYCFQRAWLWPALASLPRNPSGEYYLTDLVGIAAAQGQVIATVTGSLDETIGINDRVQLAEIEQLLRRRILERHMYAGVTIVDPATTYIEAEVEIGRDTVILPGTMISGATRIGSFCRIGPGTTIESSTLGNNCTVRQSVLEETTLEDGVSIGPFSHCRSGAYLARNVHMGNFAEVKNSSIGRETAMHHFSYIGDATLGEGVNIGAGTITCNFDGVRKNRTTIGDGAFIGSDTMLVAPVTVGEHAITGAGSVVKHDVPPGAVVAGVPARLLRPSQPADSSAADGGKKE
ncbi:MAG TPA: bifunctional UDP-N-acetylglucosamine diphosphorylase/glucosamine-1-phosphate N-acetyltransferase GlmU [Ktedonobacteraceae bacterium]|nr:bifunctional UDP-N-acetylglucosamine diphosphorylase/glucosamine-1-phosphate N-acetyltransferase GlmU [Ktedonobacteraceae bacterium]